jgi:flagellar basal-body rod protein FlgB
MSNLQLVSLAMQKSEWLAARQSVIAQNIANANTPSYKVRDLMPFEAVLANTGLEMAATSSRHMAVAEQGVSASIVTSPSNGDMTFNGNNVSLEGEMAKLGETTSQYALSTSIIKSFHKMMMLAVKA